MIGRRQASPAEAEPGASPRDRLRREAVRALWRAKSLAHVDLQRSPEHCVLLLGSARSGTTWLGEVLNRHRDHRVLFEPLRPGTVRRLAPFEGVRYLRPDDRDPARLEAMTALLSGRVRDPWVDHTSLVLLPRRRLLKEIRGNALAPWLASAFPSSPLVLVVRHPLDIAASRARLGWADPLGELLADPLLVAEHLGPQRDLLAGLTDPVVRSVAAWAVETVVPLRLLGPSACVVFYERLRDDPAGELPRVLAHVGQDPELPPGDALRRPSRTARAGGAHAGAATSPGAPVVTPRQVDESREVLEAFGLDAVYDVHDPSPDVTAAAALRR